MKPLIREMRKEDIPNIVYNDRRILGQSLGEETLETELAQNLFSKFFVMEDEQTHQFIGHVGLWIDVPLASILNLYIVPEFQHHGLGSILLEFVLGYLHDTSISTLTLEVRKSNEIAKNMYHHYGFAEAAVRKNYYADGEDAYLMLKILDPEK
jgi:ribosomal-protein-alanine N-acetyltransferase